MIVNQLARMWEKSGIQTGDTVLLHSDVSSLLAHYNFYNRPANIKGDALSVEEILDSFLAAVGDSGTLIIPLFNFDFAKGITFDIKGTRSNMGVLTEVARKRDGTVRTTNPIYSFVIFGKNKDYFKSVKLTTALGRDSVYARLIELDGKIAALGLPDNKCMTFVHHIEEMHKVPYRIYKYFTAPYVNYEGIMNLQTIKLYVRDLDNGVRTWVDPAGDLMWEEGLYHGDKFNQGLGLRTISAKRMYHFVSSLIKNSKTENVLYRIEK